MARTREFDTEAAVSRAMELFWTRGYEATSVRDLTGHLGIGQGSLYAAFGDKDGLYRAALEHYRTTLAAAALRSLEEGTDARSAIRTMLVERIRIAVDDNGRGCLAVNAACERLPEDAATRRTVRDMQDAGRDALTEVLRVAAERGEIAKRHDPHTLAAFLVTFLNGLLVSSKITPDVRALEPSWRSRWPPSTDFFMPGIRIGRSIKVAGAPSDTGTGDPTPPQSTTSEAPCPPQPPRVRPLSAEAAGTPSRRSAPR